MRLRHAALGGLFSLLLLGCGDQGTEGSLTPLIEGAYGFAEVRVRATVVELARRYPLPDERFKRDPVETRTEEPDLGAWIDQPIEDWRSGFFPGVLWELYRY